MIPKMEVAKLLAQIKVAVEGLEPNRQHEYSLTLVCKDGRDTHFGPILGPWFTEEKIEDMVMAAAFFNRPVTKAVIRVLRTGAAGRSTIAFQCDGWAS